LAAAATLTTLIVLFARFYADDTFIVARYAENLADRGELTYNLGERICAFTSPLHALLETLLYRITGRTFAANRVLSWAVLAISLGFAIRRFRRNGPSVLWLIGLTLLSPFVVVWTMGSLETPYLFALVLSLSILLEGTDPLPAAQAIAAGLTIGLCLVTRYDSIFFAGPAALSVLRRVRSRSAGLLALGLCSAPILSWLLFSYHYYHALLPTSFFVKTPAFTVDRLALGSGYLLSWFVLSGVLGPLLIARFSRGAKIDSGWRHFGAQHGWLLWGLAFEMAYGLTASTVHMMFAYRFFIPYLPAFAFLAAKMRAPSAHSPSSLSWRAAVGFALACGSQIGLGLLTLMLSADPAPFARVEFRSVSLRELMAYGDYLENMAEAVKNHWLQQEESRLRAPRIVVFAGGIWPYIQRDAYFFDELVSYRHACDPDANMADYAQQPVADGERRSPPGDSPDGVLAGTVFRFSWGLSTGIHFNAHPHPNRLPPFIDAPCAHVAD
jgi:hypothetical protein